MKNKMTPSIVGVGYIGIGNHASSINGKQIPKYVCWKHMIERCYGQKQLKEKPTYFDVTVCDEWKNYQNFADWYDENYVTGFVLDKDIIEDGNRIYEPRKCKFVSVAENNIKARAGTYEFKNPCGLNVKIHNLLKFCKSNGLSCSHMSSVHSKKERSHKGWEKA